MSFRERLKGELEYKGILVKELSHITGIPKQTIDKYLLSEGSMPPADNAVAMARALGVSVEYLVTGRDSSPGSAPGRFLSPESRSIVDLVEPLSREKRKIAENTITELNRLLEQTAQEEITALSPLQKVFLRLFR